MIINRCLLLVFQTPTSREGHRSAYAANSSAALPPPRFPHVQLLVAAEGGRGLGVLGAGSVLTLVPAGLHQLDGSGGIPPLPAPCPCVQHLRQEIPAQTQLGGMGWVESVECWDNVSTRCLTCGNSGNPRFWSRNAAAAKNRYPDSAIYLLDAFITQLIQFIVTRQYLVSCHWPNKMRWWARFGPQPLSLTPVTYRYPWIFFITSIGFCSDKFII